MKTITKAAGTICCAAILFAGLAREARADAWNKKTILTISDPLQVPKVVLEPGKYVLKLADSASDRHIVQIFNADETKIIATILAIPNYRLQVTGKSEFGFWETPAGQPRALRAWFYPGDNFGHEFAYPKDMSVQITSYSKQTVPVITEEEVTTAKVEQTAEEVKPAEQKTEETTVVIAQNTQPAQPEPAPAPFPVVEPEPTPAPVSEPIAEPVREQADQAPTSLPQTASNYPLIALIGLLSLGTFTAMSLRSYSSKH